jgi:hypothetical protein
VRRTVLERLFDDLNAELFRGRISACAVIRVSYLERIYGCDGLYEPHYSRIVVQSGLPAWAERRVLLHEMCHASLPGYAGHGAPFLAQLRRLAQRGETWAIREAHRYATDPWLRTIDALDDLDHQWHALPNSASKRARCLILTKANRLLARL